jgi:tetratricopeptide repeat protein
MRGLVLSLVISALVLAVAARPARAMQLSPQQKQDVRVHYERATRAYDLNKYSEAIDEYQKVYEIDGDPVMLYNIGQAYRLNDQPQESIHFYRRYLQRQPDARNRDDVDRKIASLEKLIEDRSKAAPAVTPPPPNASPQPTWRPEASSPVSPVATAVTPPVVVIPAGPVPPSDTQRAVGWSMVGVGVASGVVAVIEGIRAKNFGDQLTKAANVTTPPPFNPATESSGKTANVVAIVCGIAGTAVAVAGVIVLITNGSSSSSSPAEPTSAPPTNVSFTPWLGPGLVGGGMGLRF